MFVNTLKLAKNCEHSIRDEATNINGVFDNNVYKTIMLCIDMLIFYMENMEDGIYFSMSHWIELYSDGLNIRTYTLKVDNMIILSYRKSKDVKEITFCNAALMIDDSTLVPFINLAEKQ